MTETPALVPATLRAVLDLRHPLAYLALPAALDFARERGIDCDWLPLEAQTLRPPSKPGPQDDRSLRHKRHRAQMIAREIAVYADARGLRVREPYRNGSPRAAHLAWLWVRGRSPEALPGFLEELFRRYWALELDAAEVGDLLDLLGERGLDPASFEAWSQREGPEALERLAAALREAGIGQVPAFQVEDEVFYGRQHWPMIGWILDGRVGPGPI